MIGAISSNSNLLDTISSQYSPEATGRTSGAARAEKDAPQKGAADEIKATHGNRDTVTISPEGAAYAQQAAAAKVNQDGTSVTAKTAADTVTSTAKTATDTAVKSAAAKVEETEAAKTEAASTTEEEDDSDLSEYTDAELKQMMYKGDITRSEYDEEMVSRNGYPIETEE